MLYIPNEEILNESIIYRRYRSLSTLLPVIIRRAIKIYLLNLKDFCPQIT